MPIIPIEDMLGSAAIIAGIVWALVEGLKKVCIGAWSLQNGSAAAVALLLGPALAILWTMAYWQDLSWRGLVQPGLTGLIGSLAAMGVYKLTNWSPPEPPPVEPPK